MASAYIGTLTMPPLFGVLANAFTIRLYPFFMAAILLGGILSYRRLRKLTAG